MSSAFLWLWWPSTGPRVIWALKLSSNLSYLEEIDPEDYLMLTLYANNDTENILYEWAASTAIYIEKVDPDFPEIDLNWDDVVN